MSPAENGPQQNNLEGESFALTPDIILKNKDVVIDFFGDNREKWYSLLARSGSLRKKVLLHTREELPSESDPEVGMSLQELPLDPSAITEERAKHIAVFFREYPAALADFLEYSKWYTKDSATDETTS